MSSTEKTYRSKVTQTEIDMQPPDHAMPAKRDAEPLTVVEPARGFSAKWLALLSGIGCVVGFSLFEAVTFIESNFASSDQIDLFFFFMSLALFVLNVFTYLYIIID